jgi:LysR family glycine cleavage system transcriptional activator
MRRRLPRIEQIEAFIAAARSRNFRVAAQHCSLSPAALSRRIQSLAEYTGHALFRRESGTMRLTEFGKQYLQQLEPSFLELCRAASLCGPQGNDRNLVKLSLSHSLAVGWLIPRLGALRIEYPQINLSLQFHRDAAGVRSGEVDLAICAVDVDVSNLGARPLLSVSATPLASPSVADSFRAGTARLQNQQLLASTQSPNLWSYWARATACEDIPKPHATFDVLYAMYETAAHGLGVALGSTPTVDQHLHSGRLVRLGLPAVQLADFYRLVAARASLKKRSVIEVRDWLIDEARKTRDPFGAAHAKISASDILSDSRAH